MSQYIRTSITDLCNAIALPQEYADYVVSAVLAAGFVVAIFLAQYILRKTITAFSHIWAKHSSNTFDDALCEANVPAKSAHLLSAILGINLASAIFAESSALLEFFSSAANIYFAIACGGAIYAGINATMIFSMKNDRLRDVPIKGFFQALQVLLTLAVGIWILSILLDKSPAYFLSGLGALMAIITIVFKDTLLGFTAGIMISANDLTRLKDWIEIESAGVDGEVIEVSLTTVKVRNWDNTISTVPAYTLISTAFKNWRGMKESGGRRIKRAINIDMQTIHFAAENEIEHWRKIDLLKPYLAQKLTEIREANAEKNPDSANASPANIRLLSNIGTFRAYCVAYLKANKKIRQGANWTMLVRQLNPSPNGLPIEIYVFTTTTEWGEYENIQSDIFDHLLAVLPEFGLAPYQEPSGRNFEKLHAPRER